MNVEGQSLPTARASPADEATWEPSVLGCFLFFFSML